MSETTCSTLDVRVREFAWDVAVHLLAGYGLMAVGARLVGWLS